MEKKDTFEIAVESLDEVIDILTKIRNTLSKKEKVHISLWRKVSAIFNKAMPRFMSLRFGNEANIDFNKK